MGKSNEHRQQRTALGDLQAGQVTRTTKGVEVGADYQLHARGGDMSNPVTMATHHLNGLADQGAITETMTKSQLDHYRDYLKTGTYYIGNQSNNYTGQYDGKMSPRGVQKRGIYSYDHKDVHDKITKGFQGIGYDPKGKTFNGIPISKLPEPMKHALGLQIAFISENANDEVQRARMNTLRQAFPNDTYEQRKDRILNNPQSFASIDTKKRPIPDKYKSMLPKGVMTSLRNTIKAVSNLGKNLEVGTSQMDEDLMTPAQRLGINLISNYSQDTL
jgi:hypothetical protein